MTHSAVKTSSTKGGIVVGTDLSLMLVHAVEQDENAAVAAKCSPAKVQDQTKPFVDKRTLLTEMRRTLARMFAKSDPRFNSRMASAMVFEQPKWTRALRLSNKQGTVLTAGHQNEKAERARSQAGV